MRCCGCFALALVLAAVLAVGAVAYTGLVSVPVVSGIVGSDQPRDLGTRPTKVDYDAFAKKAPITRGSVDFQCFTCPMVFSGRQDVDQTFTDREIGAWLTTHNAKYGPIRDVQVKFHANGSAEMSGRIAPNVPLPEFVPRGATFYVAGSIRRESAKSVGFDFSRIEVGRVPLPDEIVRQANEAVGLLVSQQLGTVGPLDIQSLEVGNGSVRFKGALPQSAIGSAPKP